MVHVLKVMFSKPSELMHISGVENTFKKSVYTWNIKVNMLMFFKVWELQ